MVEEFETRLPVDGMTAVEKLDPRFVLHPEARVKEAHFRILVGDPFVGRDEVESWGGKVVLADILDGHSTTATLRRLGK